MSVSGPEVVGPEMVLKWSWNGREMVISWRQQLAARHAHSIEIYELAIEENSEK
jgi:hypothetical protein